MIHWLFHYLSFLEMEFSLNYTSAKFFVTTVKKVGKRMNLSDCFSSNGSFPLEQLKSFPQLLQNIHCLEVYNWANSAGLHNPFHLHGFYFCYIFLIWWFPCCSDLLYTYSWLIFSVFAAAFSDGRRHWNSSLLLHYINCVRDESVLLRLYHWLSQTFTRR